MTPLLPSRIVIGMQNEFYGLQLSKQELMELHAALAERALVEEDLRHEKGLECVHSRPLLEKVTALLSVSPEQQDRLAALLDDELWEHAWYRFTDEWAWYRAEQEVDRETQKRPRSVSHADRERLVEQRYQRDFESFVQELEMGERKKA